MNRVLTLMGWFSIAALLKTKVNERLFLDS